nr:PREDICTED: DBH-like monooxygenase protein 2 [Anolis carolinensis]|eukprot:XP_008114858.1 PREDICTED: DBH-like monooxygenase protein 2 [Anolis carolinensis]
MNWKLVNHLMTIVFIKLIGTSLLLFYFSQIFHKASNVTSKPDVPIKEKDSPIRWVPFDGKCYYFSAAENTWDESQQECARSNSHLAVINNNTELGGPSTLNEMCLIFLFYYPRNNISSCLGYPDIQYVANELGQEASDEMEGMMGINLVDWDNETIKKAEKACKEAEQTVIIKTIDELVRNETSFIREISDTILAPCKDISRAIPAPWLKRQTEYKATPPTTAKALGAKSIFPLPPLLFLSWCFTWLLTSSV